MNLPRYGLGCMSLSHAYGVAPQPEEGLRLLQTALDEGVTFFDTATLYGGGRNEELVGKAIAGRRDEIILASKGGMAIVDGSRVIDGRPETLRAQVDASLRRLDVDHIDLYYLHRWDKSVPIADICHAIVDSSELGIRKPDPRIFEHALETLGGIDPSRAIFVDDFEANVEAAEALGFRGVLMKDDYHPALAEIERLTR